MKICDKYGQYAECLECIAERSYGREAQQSNQYTEQRGGDEQVIADVFLSDCTTETDDEHPERKGAVEEHQPERIRDYGHVRAFQSRLERRGELASGRQGSVDLLHIARPAAPFAFAVGEEGMLLEIQSEAPSLC